MKKRLILMMFFTIIFRYGYADGKVLQKVVLTFDKNQPTRQVNQMLYQAVIGNTESVKKIVLLPDDSHELAQRKIRSVNVRVFLQSIESNGQYIFSLYEVKKNETNRIDKVFVSDKDGFIDQISRLSIAVINTLRRSFPPMPKKLLKKIVVVKRRLSEFETGRPTWRISLGVGRSRFYQKLSLNIISTNNTNYMYYLTNISSLTFSSDIEFQYRSWFAGLQFRTSLSFSEMTGHFYLAKGIIGSLFVLGVDVGADYYHFMTVNPINAPDQGGTIQSIGGAEIGILQIGVGSFLRINITKNYYIEALMRMPLTQKYDIRNVVNNKSPYQQIPLSDQGPAMTFVFHIRLNPKTAFLLKFSTYSVKYYNSNRNIELNAEYENNIFASSAEAGIQNISLGISYEL